MKAKLIKIKDGYELFTQGFLKGSTNHELIDSLNVEEGNIRYKLSLKNCQAIELGYDLDELAEEYAEENAKDNNISYHNLYVPLEYAYRHGFQKCLELMSDKKFSENDLLQAIEMYYGEGKTFIEIIQSLQKTEWDVEIEMEYVGECNGNNDNGCFQDSPGHNCGCFERKPKLDATGCLILKTFKSE